MHLSLCATFALVANIAVAAPSSSYNLHERRDSVPVEWQHKYEADPKAQVPVRIGLTQSNLDRGHGLLMEVSDHKSPNYGKYYSQEKVNELFAPTEETVNTVRGWLEHAGLAADRVSQSFNKQWLQFDASIAELEELIMAKYHVYEHHSGKNHVACDEYHVPAEIQAHVDYITPGIKLYDTARAVEKRDVTPAASHNFKLPLFPEPISTPIGQIKTQAAKGDLSTCSAIMTPACIKALYNITEGKLAAPGNQLGIFEDLNDHYAQADLNDFFASAYPKIPQGTHPELRGIDGAIGPVAVAKAGLESSLDFQISYPIIYPQGSVLFQTDDQPTEMNYTYVGFLNNFLAAIDGSYCPNTKYDPQYPDPKPGGYKGQLQCGAYKPTNVISISYGGLEAGMPIAYQKRQCNEYMKLGMQGISVIASSGDSGVGPRGSPCLGKDGNVFTPGFPINCPYVTAIGGTFLDAGKDVKKDEEIAVTRFPSGGGFSNIFPTADYQKSAVNNFLTKYPPPYLSYQTSNHLVGRPGRFNSAGRGYPDFSAVGDRVLVFGNGKAQTIGGTSASAPVFASIINRINEERIAAGKGTIGFVNPTLYSHPNVFHDITVGSNPNCNSQGFSCAPGWDPVTGLGTPNYPQLLKVFMALP